MAVAAVACLAVGGCSAISSRAAGISGSSPAGASASPAHLVLGTAPGMSGLGAASSKVKPPDPLGPPADPFAGTPADHWADGAAGIAAPTAKAVGGFTKDQVKYAYQETRQLLVAANLDKQTLLGGAPTAFAGLLTSPQRSWFEQGLNKRGMDKTGASLSTRPLVMSFAPGSTQLIGSVIKVNGTMHAKAVNKSGPELDISLDYLFAYAVEPPGRPDDWMRIVNEVVWTVEFGNWQGVASSFAPWVVTTGAGGVAGADCDSTDGYSHPDYPDAAVPGATPSVTASGTPVNPYVAGQPRNAGCQATTGT
jgi:hypothetical protein